MKLNTYKNVPNGTAAAELAPALTVLCRAIDRALLASAGGAFLTAAAAGTLALPAGEALAATIAVDAGAVDDDNSNGNCSLVEAVRAANTDTAVDACTAGDGADTLVLPPDSAFTFENANDESDGANALPSISSEVAVQGNGAVIERSDASGTPDFRLLHVATNGTLSLTGVTVNNGAASTASGGSDGGGIFNAGSLELERSIVSGNFASNKGGGLHVAVESTTSLVDSTVDDNDADWRGGGISSSATVTLNQTTISGNYARFDGGGIHSTGPLTLEHSTVVRNATFYDGSGGGINSFSGSLVTLSHSIVAGNFAYFGSDIDAPTVGANSHNLFGTDSLYTDEAIEGFTPGPTDITATVDGTDPTDFDDMLDNLSDNGGPTPTYALIPGSPAIDAGDPDFTPPPDHDQRGPGFPRVVGSAVDIGAYELESRIFVDRFEQ